MSAKMLTVEEVAQKERDDKKLGFDRVELLHGSTYKDCSTVIVVPTRGMIHHKVCAAWDAMIAPMNQKRVKFYATGEEVGVAYNNMLKNILEHPELSKFKYVLSLEDDNMPLPDAHIRLLESIELGPFAAVGGLYFTKGDWNMPMAYGDPKEFAKTNVIDFRPRNVVEALRSGNVMEVNGLAMGCTLWRLSIFKEMAPPWFVTLNEVTSDRQIKCATQDLYFCERLKRAGKRLAVDLRVHVGHLDVATGIVY